MPDEDVPPYLLSVEGPSDRAVVRAIWDLLDNAAALTIEAKGGDRQLLRSIAVDAVAPERIALGVVVDANGNPAGRWQGLIDRFDQIGIALPSHPDPAGTIVIPQPATRSPRIGIWMMPDNGSAGALEDFLRTMISEDDRLWLESDSYVSKITEIEQRFAASKRLRAVIYSWLAVQRDPRQPGEAIGFGWLDPESRQVARFRQWLRNLFDPPILQGLHPASPKPDPAERPSP